MTRFKDFGSGSKVKADPIEFKLYDETFNVRPRVQGKVLLGLVGDSGSTDVTVSSKVIIEFFNAVIVPEDLDRFNALLDDPDKIVEVETLGEITGWLMEQYSDRPEEQPEVS